MKKRIYVFSDLHLNIIEDSKSETILNYLSVIVPQSASAIYLNGDIIDIIATTPSPKGEEVIREFFRILRKLSLTGIKIYYNLGNHDLPLLLLSPKFLQESERFNVYGNDFQYQLLKNVLINYRTIRFMANGKQVYMEHGHIYDIGWVIKPGWESSWDKCGSIISDHPIEDRIISLWNIFGGTTEDYSARLIRTGSHLPLFVDSIRAAQTIANKTTADIILLGHFHSPFIGEVGNGKIYANSGDSVQHSTFLTIDTIGIHIHDWYESAKEI